MSLPTEMEIVSPVQIPEIPVNKVNDLKYYRPEISVEEVLNIAHSKGAKSYVIQFKPLDDKSSLPFSKSRKIHQELQKKLKWYKEISYFKFTRNKLLLAFTNHPKCAAELCSLSSILNIPIIPKLNYDQISKKFLLRNVSLDDSLQEIAEELKQQKIFPLSLTRFTKKSEDNKTSEILTETILISVIGDDFPPDLKLWNFHYKTIEFIERPRQCSNCLRYGHSSKTCRSKVRCPKCGEEHVISTCISETTQCALCKRGHLATDLNCPTRHREIEALKYKNKFRVSLFEARAVIKNRYGSNSYAQALMKKPINVEVPNKQETKGKPPGLSTNIVSQPVNETEKFSQIIKSAFLEISSDFKNLVQKEISKLQENVDFLTEEVVDSLQNLEIQHSKSTSTSKTSKQSTQSAKETMYDILKRRQRNRKAQSQ